MPDLKHVAIVEDNPDNQLLIQALLEGRYATSAYENGAAALEGIPKLRPDLILLDISLPGMDGLEVLRRLRVDPDLAKIPVIALTAHAMSGDREKYLSAGFDEYVAKPILDENVLFGAIEKLI
jgi:CheY-like chemotaxis protein